MPVPPALVSMAVVCMSQNELVAVPVGRLAPSDPRPKSGMTIVGVAQGDEAAQRAAGAALHAPDAVDLIERSEIERGEGGGDGGVAAGHRAKRIGLRDRAGHCRTPGLAQLSPN